MTRIVAMGMGVALSLALLAVAPARADDTYNACFKALTNKVRPSSLLVNATPICRSTETLHTWNQTGPQGPQGPAGFVASCHPEEQTGTCNANTFAVLNVSCASGHATGASAIWHTPFDAADNGPFYILPRTDSTWTIVPYNHTGTAQDFRFFLQCCG